MTYRVELEVFQGAEAHPRTRTTCNVESDAPLSAMLKAEQHTNVGLPDNRYAVARVARPVRFPRPMLALFPRLAHAA
jgi:hypothetical protein